MEFKEIKKLILFARKSGVRALTVGDVAFELYENKTQMTRSQRKLTARDDVVTEISQEPTLEDINNYIYKDEE